MIIKGLLISGLLGIMLYAALQYHRSRLLAQLMVTTSVTGVALVMFPETTNRIAQTVGVGRGADLVLYCFVIFTLMAIFNIHLRMRASVEESTELARAIALMSAKQPTVNSRSPGGTS
jgi:small membrane protein